MLTQVLRSGHCTSPARHQPPVARLPPPPTAARQAF
jgi:hypothetical protein